MRRCSSQTHRPARVSRDAFTDPVVLQVDETLELTHMQAVVRGLSRAVGMSPSGTMRLIAGASQLAGPLFQGTPRAGRILLRLLRTSRAIGLELVLESRAAGSRPRTSPDAADDLCDECEFLPTARGGSRLLVRQWESRAPSDP